jgi:thiaminase/transcriptional activator TenA
MQQDSLYLLHFSRALAVTCGGTSDEKHVEALLTAAQNALLAERALHEHYFAEYGVSRAKKESPACLGYTSFLLATASLGSFGESVWALLPCFWIYREVGNSIAREAASPNPYARWIETYSDVEFSAKVDAFVNLADALAAQASERELGSMKEKFMTASYYEYHFWDDAYHMRAFEV